MIAIIGNPINKFPKSSLTDFKIKSVKIENTRRPVHILHRIIDFLRFLAGGIASSMLSSISIV